MKKYKENIIKQIKEDRNKCKKVLLIEFNSCHGETIPSVYNYFKKLDYSVDILLNNVLYAQKPLNCIKKDKDKFFSLSIKFVKDLLQDPNFIKEYDYIFFNSYHSYLRNNPKDLVNVFDYLKPCEATKKTSYCGFVHNLEGYNSDSNGFQPFVLANMQNETREKFKTLNPHYFGEYKSHKKNKKTRFIMIGAIEQRRRNCNLLIYAVERLYKKGIKNFEIIVIGKGNLNNIPKHIRSFFKIKGRLKYSEMYKEMQKADYFLPLLDPTNPEHDRYITTGTSGSFQLIYGFLKPCLIQEKFSEPHGFNAENSFIYKENDDLAKVMKSAINQNNEEYEFMKNNLKEFANNLYKLSLEELSSYVKESHEIKLS